MDLRQIRKGSTRTLILSLLSGEAMYGYQVARELQQRSGGYFAVSEGLLYPALHHMEREGLVSSEWQAYGKRRRRYYAITPEGREWLQASVAQWQAFMEQFTCFLQDSGTWAGVPGGEVSSMGDRDASGPTP